MLQKLRSRLGRVMCLFASLALFGAAAALLIFFAQRTHADTDAEIVGWSVLVSLSLAGVAGYLAYLGLK